jgi:hypothetical protein
MYSFVEFGNAPHFFPATASGLGFRAGFGSFLVPPAAPACALLLPPLASAPSTASAPRAADCKPRLRCAAASGHPTGFFPRPRSLVEGPLQSALLIALASQPYRLWGQPNITGYLANRLPIRQVPQHQGALAPFAPAADRHATIYRIAAAPAITFGVDGRVIRTRFITACMPTARLVRGGRSMKRFAIAFSCIVATGFALQSAPPKASRSSIRGKVIQDPGGQPIRKVALPRIIAPSFRAPRRRLPGKRRTQHMGWSTQPFRHC